MSNSVCTSQGLLVDLKNEFFAKCQKSKFAAFARDSLLFKYIDNMTFIFLTLSVLSTAFAPTGIIGFFAIMMVVCTVFKLLVKSKERFVVSSIDIALSIFLAVALLSLFGSSLFLLSLKGFLKFITYMAFYFCSFHFLNSNKSKILPLLALVAILISFESIVGILQNFTGIMPISTWQDTSNLDVQEVISRCYGTLNPYNPNLLAGYLLAGMSTIFYFSAIHFVEKNLKRSMIFLLALLLSFLALIYTGSRGGYLGLLAFLVVALVGIYFYIKSTIGFENIKKRYKNTIVFFGSAFTLIVLTSPPVLKRILSIFALREDSSISFRLNVYEASIRMFLDNLFIGIGLGNQNFREIYGLYMKTTFDALGAYSVPLEIAVEMGIFGLLAFVYFLFVAIKACIVLLREDTAIKSKILVFSVLLMLVATMVHGLWDTVWYRPQVQILFWLNIAVLNTLVLKPKLTLVKGL